MDHIFIVSYNKPSSGTLNIVTSTRISYWQEQGNS